MSNVKDVMGLTLYQTDRLSLALLSDTDRGQLLISLFDFLDGVDTSERLTPQTQIAYAFISARMSDDVSRRRYRSEVNRENAAKRWSRRESITSPEEGG